MTELLAGRPADGFESVAALLGHGREESSAEACKTDRENALAPATVARETRTSRAARFVQERCREKPEHVTYARRVYAAYVRWCRRHEPDAPLSPGAFYRVLEDWAPHEGRVHSKVGGRGRPRLAFLGVVLTRPRAGVG